MKSWGWNRPSEKGAPTLPTLLIDRSSESCIFNNRQIKIIWNKSDNLTSYWPTTVYIFQTKIFYSWYFLKNQRRFWVKILFQFCFLSKIDDFWGQSILPKNSSRVIQFIRQWRNKKRLNWISSVDKYIENQLNCIPYLIIHSKILAILRYYAA